MTDQGNLTDFDSALFLLRMYVRLKRYLLPEEVFYYCRRHEQDYHFRQYSYDFDVANSNDEDSLPKIEPLPSDLVIPSESGNEPRALKKRSKKVRTERRSKSVEHRRKRHLSLHNSIPKSKDDLDFGTFTVIGRPPNPWFLENSLKKGKSLPSIQGNLEQVKKFSQSTPHLQETQGETPALEKDTQSPLSKNEKKRDFENLSNESANRSEVVIKVNSRDTVEKELNTSKKHREFSTTSIIDVQKYFKECVVTINTSISEQTGKEQNELILKTLATDLEEAEKLKKSFEDLLEIIGEAAKDCQMEPFFGTRSLSIPVDLTLQTLESFSKDQVEKSRQKIFLKESPLSFDSSNNCTIEDTFEMIEEFVQQLFQGNLLAAKIDDNSRTDNQEVGMLSNDVNGSSLLPSKYLVAQPPLPSDSHTFTYYYSIDAEISQTEYLKLMKAINILKKQKKQWNDKVEELQKNIESADKEKGHLVNNNEILRESLEAANRAIREINEKVRELKETLVPLRNENSILREENEALKEDIDQLNKDNVLASKDSEGLLKMKEIYEEKSKCKEKETEEFKLSMHEKFKKLEDLYRNYQKDMEERNLKLIREREELSKIHEAMKSEIDALRRENTKFKKETEKLSEDNDHLESKLQKKKTENMKFLENTKIFENSQEVELFYKKEVEESNKTLAKMISEIEKHKSEAWSFEESNNKLKHDLNHLESHIRVLEAKNDEAASSKMISEQQIEFLENEVELLRKENKQLESIKQDKSDLEITQNVYASNISKLETKVKELETIKREHTSQNHENQRLKLELEKTKANLNDLENKKHEFTAEKYENEKLRMELKHLQEQIKLFEDQQKLSDGPYKVELKGELQSIRAQMAELANATKDKQLELYTNELKGELASLKDQIKELDVGRSQSRNSVNLSEDEPNVGKKAPERPSSTNAINNSQRKRDETEPINRPASSGGDRIVHMKHVSRNLQRRNSTGDINRIYVSKSTELSRKEKEDDKLKQIEDRIRRKREKNTDWSLRTPSIERLRRKSTEELASLGLSNEQDEDDSTSSYSLRRSDRSPSIGRRSKSAGPRGYSSESHQFRERGRSPKRRDRSFPQGEQEYFKFQKHPPRYQPYEVEILIDDDYPMQQPESFRHPDHQNQRNVISVPHSRKTERNNQGGKFNTYAYSNNYMDETSSDDYERYDSRKFRSMDYRLMKPVAGRPPVNHNDHEMLVNATEYRQTDAYSKLQYQQNSQQKRQNHRTDNQQSYGSAYHPRIEDDDWEPLIRENGKHQKKHYYSSSDLYDHRGNCMNENLNSNSRRYTAPSKDMKGMIEVPTPSLQHNGDLKLRRAKTLDKDFWTNEQRERVQRNQNRQREEMIRTIKAEQALKLTLTPKEHHELHPSKPPLKPPRSFESIPQNSDRRMISEEELFEQERMEKARQRMLRKMQDKNVQQNVLKENMKQSRNSAITKGGIPIDRRNTTGSKRAENRTSEGEKGRNRSITMKKLTSKTKQTENTEEMFRGQNGEEFKKIEISKNEKIRRNKDSTHHHTMRENQINQQSNKQVHQQSNKDGRPRSVPHVKHSNRYDDSYIDDRNASSRGRKDKYHCDVCKKLNQNKREGEPMRYCWERYYAVSSSTPGSSEHIR